jgi:hypothetical protein
VSQSIYVASAAKESKGDTLLPSDLSVALIEMGFVIGRSPKSDYFLSINHASSQYREFIARGGQAKYAALVRLEPAAVFPAQYRDSIIDKYDLVVSPGRVDGVNKDEFIGWPYEVVANPQQPVSVETTLKEHIEESLKENYNNFENWLERKHHIVMINANKVSPISKELYSLRRSYARNMPAGSLVVYGGLWNEPLYDLLMYRVRVMAHSLKHRVIPNLRHLYGNLHWSFKSAKGLTPKKRDIVKNSRFSLVIENDSSYVSEKLFDALIYGSIPIYLGPDLRLAGLPPEIIIPLEHKPDDLWSYLSSLSDEFLFLKWSAIKSFLESDTLLLNWDKSIVYRQIAQKIAFHFRQAS